MKTTRSSATTIAILLIPTCPRLRQINSIGNYLLLVRTSEADVWTAALHSTSFRRRGLSRHPRTTKHFWMLEGNEWMSSAWPAVISISGRSLSISLSLPHAHHMLLQPLFRTDIISMALNTFNACRLLMKCTTESTGVSAHELSILLTHSLARPFGNTPSNWCHSLRTGW